MNELERLRAGDAELERQERELKERRDALKTEERRALAELREAATALRRVRQARWELQRRLSVAENPVPPTPPEVETIIQSVVATAEAANAPPETEV